MVRLEATNVMQPIKYFFAMLCNIKALAVHCIIL